MVCQLACKFLCYTTNTYSPAEKIVQVPTMAESITEGTLKQFSKREYCL
jgi:2-oxoglutarate dehydrogenase E2 component (dihydrolipoamide succinyltransferase)